MKFQFEDIKELDDQILDIRRWLRQNTDNMGLPNDRRLFLFLAHLLIARFFKGRRLDDFAEAEKLEPIIHRHHCDQLDQELFVHFKKNLVLAIYWVQEIRKVTDYRPQHYSSEICARMKGKTFLETSPVRIFIFSTHLEIHTECE